MSGASSSGIQLATNDENNAASCTAPAAQVVGQEVARRQRHQEWLREMRGWLMVIATLVAGITYQAGLNPPGGFWQQDDSQGHVAGYPVLPDKFAYRYDIFFFFNATSFVTSLVIILLLMNQSFYHTETRLKVLEVTMMVDLVGLMGAFAAGSCRKLKWSVYVLILVVGVFCYVVYLARRFEVLTDELRRKLGLGPAPPPNAQAERGAPAPTNAAV